MGNIIQNGPDFTTDLFVKLYKQELRDFLKVMVPMMGGYPAHHNYYLQKVFVPSSLYALLKAINEDSAKDQLSNTVEMELPSVWVKYLKNIVDIFVVECLTKQQYDSNSNYRRLNRMLRLKIRLMQIIYHDDIVLKSVFDGIDIAATADLGVSPDEIVIMPAYELTLARDEALVLDSFLFPASISNGQTMPGLLGNSKTKIQDSIITDIAIIALNQRVDEGQIVADKFTLEHLLTAVPEDLLIEDYYQSSHDKPENMSAKVGKSLNKKNITKIIVKGD
tara:strand:+ start:1773 stop:2606 length:834 start_codon:yes stop_codon:yes gene_type:complete